MKTNRELSTIQLGEIMPISLSTPYQREPLDAFLSLRSESGEHLLLESAEVDSRQNLKSLMLLDASLRIVCQGQQVTVTALTDNGEVLLSWLKKRLNQYLADDHSATEASFEFKLPAADLDEAKRLQATSNIEVLKVLQHELKATESNDFCPFVGGVFAYDYVATFEALPEVPSGDNTCPDYQFYLAETLMIIDHQEESATLIGALAGGAGMEARYLNLCKRMGEILARVQLPQLHHTQKVTEPKQSQPLVVSPSDENFIEVVEGLKEAIVNGDIFQVVPSRQFKLTCRNPLHSYAQLKKDNPSPYMFYLQANDFELFGASPESALKFTASSRQTELYPIAGTRQRAKKPDGTIHLDRDARIELSLRQDQKELAEHMMLVDLARNDLARIGVAGSRYVADLLKVDRYSHVMHLVSRVVATLKPELDALDAYRACMNMGTLVGAQN